ncbi:MAG: hypothetical protein AB1489_39305 [Acidobacteriota bacterium]
MKIRIFSVLFFVMLFAATGILLSSTAYMAGKPVTAKRMVGAQDFTVVNKTGVVINSLYVSPTHVNEWEEDILGRDTLPPGESVLITFDRDEEAAKWDIRVEDSEGNALVWEGLNLLEISKVTLFFNNGKATAQVE